MKLKLNRPLIFFDLETTGVDAARDRIVEISLVKVFPNGDEEIKTRRINPGMPIPPEHGDKGKRGKKNYNFSKKQKKQEGKKIPRTFLQQAVRGCRQVIPFRLSPGA